MAGRPVPVGLRTMGLLGRRDCFRRDCVVGQDCGRDCGAQGCRTPVHVGLRGVGLRGMGLPGRQDCFHRDCVVGRAAVGGIAGHRVAEETGLPDAQSPWDCVAWDCFERDWMLERVVVRRIAGHSVAEGTGLLDKVCTWDCESGIACMPGLHHPGLCSAGFCSMWCDSGQPASRSSLARCHRGPRRRCPSPKTPRPLSATRLCHDLVHARPVYSRGLPRHLLRDVRPACLAHDLGARRSCQLLAAAAAHL